MAFGKHIETRGHIVGFKEEIATISSQEADFFTWFNDAKDKDSSFVRGSWDFMLHIAQPASHLVSSPEEKIALEIGHGGGRILAACCRCFKNAVGVDVHDNNDRVESELRSRGIHNFTLLQTNGKEIPVSSNSIDFVYSFIVFQHVEQIEVFKTYLSETSRILKPGGVAVLYFGRRWLLSLNRGSRLLYWFDQLMERFLLPRGYQERPARVNCTNLFVSLAYAKQLARQLQFKVHSSLVSHKHVPDGIALYGGQHGLVLRKKES